MKKKIKINIKSDKVQDIKRASRKLGTKVSTVIPLKKVKKRYNKPTPEEIDDY